MNQSEKDKLYWLKQMSDLLILRGQEYDRNGYSREHSRIDTEYQVARNNYFRLRGEELGAVTGVKQKL